MRITTIQELKAFLMANYDHITNEQYVDIMSHTLGVYEHSKPEDKEKLMRKIDLHSRFLEHLPNHYEQPLFWAQ